MCGLGQQLCAKKLVRNLRATLTRELCHLVRLKFEYSVNIGLEYHFFDKIELLKLFSVYSNYFTDKFHNQ